MSDSDIQDVNGVLADSLTRESLAKAAGVSNFSYLDNGEYKNEEIALTKAVLLIEMLLLLKLALITLALINV